MPTILRPSGAYIWTNCAAAPTFQERVPEDPPSDAAREGTAAAWLAELALKSGGMCREYLNETHENGWLITAEMVYYVQEYVDLLRSYHGQIAVEQRVILTDFIQGTLDASVIVNSGNVLRIKDLKYGFEIHEVFEHIQLLIYAAAELRRLGNPPHITHVEIAIYQPRAPHPDGPHRTWTLTVPQLWEWAEWIVTRGTECMMPNPVATPGKHCKRCRALTSCVAAQNTLQNGYEFIARDQRQHHKSAEDLAKLLDFLDLLNTIGKAAQTAAIAEAEQRVTNGEHIRGWFFKPRKGHRVWKYHPALIAFATGVRPFTETLMTPPEMERAGVPKKLVDSLARAPDIGRKFERMPDNYLRKVMDNG